MNSYLDRTRTEVATAVAAQTGGDGTADVWVSLKTDAQEIELVSRVSREDLPKLIGDLFECVADDDRAALLETLTKKRSA